jgi:hypothetical protein
MSFLRHGQIYQSDGFTNRGQRSPAAPAIVSMSLRPAVTHAQGNGGWRQPPPDGGDFQPAEWGMKDRRRARLLTRPEDQQPAATALAGAPNDPRRGKERK